MADVPMYGFEKRAEDIKNEIRSKLVSCARRRHPITYSELTQSLQTFRLAPNDPRLFRLLGEISVEEDEQGRGMLSVLVVHKGGDAWPGEGFFELAVQRGRDVRTDRAREKVYADEMARVLDVWKKP